MKELTFSIQNKQEQELSIVMQGHKVPITIVVGTSHMDLEMEDVDDLIKALHMMKSQHKTFVNVEPMGVQDLKKGECSPSNQKNVYANLPTPPKVEQKKDHVEYFKDQAGRYEIQQSTNTYLLVEDEVKHDNDAETKEIQLKVGQKYKDRTGRIWTVDEEMTGTEGDARYHHGYRFLAYCGKNGPCYSYTPCGRFIADGREHEYDLIELVEDVPTPPKVENKKDYVEYFKEQSGKVEIQQSTKTYLSVEDKTTDENDAEKKKIQLRVGQIYKARRGDIWIVVGENGNGTFDCESEIGSVGRFYGNGRYFSKDEHEYDLIELISSQPDKDEHGRWILNEGDTVMLSNGVEGVVIKKDDSGLPYKIGYYDKGQTKSEWLYGTDDDKHTGSRIYITSIVKRAK